MENSRKGYTPIMEKPDYRKSQGAKIPTKIAKQSTTVVSSTETEYIVAAEASMKVVWMRKFIDGLGDVMPSNKRHMEMLCDNDPTLAIASDLRILKGARQFQRKYHYICKAITSTPKKGATTVGNASKSSSMWKTTVNSTTKSNISMSNPYSALDDESNKDVENVYDESTNLFQSTKMGGSSATFTDAAG
ncbi:hypothetical protein Tco_1442902 [Tanacetum coccineum]